MKRFQFIMLVAGLIFGFSIVTFAQEANDTVYITAELDTLRDGKVYTLNSTCTISDRRLYVQGTAVLHLTDGFKLTVPKGIELSDPNHLIINGDANNTGQLICDIPTSDLNKSGIGANKVGHLTINGGTVKAYGGIHGAGIGGDAWNELNYGTVIINGGIVTAYGGTESAGIGGGYTNWSGNYGSCFTITINGGQVTADSGWNAPGIGPGLPMNGNCNNPSGNVTFGWTNPTDFILVRGYGEDYAIGKRVTHFTFAENKYFTLEDGTGVRPENLREMYEFKLVPLSASDRYDLSKAVVENMDDEYYYTGSAIQVPYILIDVAGDTLVEGTHYSTVITCGGQPVGDITFPNEYLFTFTAIPEGGYTGSTSAATTMVVHRPEALRQNTYTENGGEITWENPYYAGSWTIELCENNSFSGDVISFYPAGNLTTSYAITGLTPEHSYYARMKAKVSTYESVWSETIRFYPSATKWLGFGSTDDYAFLPTFVAWPYSFSEQIYQASEIDKAGTIYSVAFCYLASNPITRTADIYLLHTNKTKFDYKTWIIPEESDKVFSGDVTFDGNGTWTTITLQSPFAYNGQDNLLLVMYDHSTNSTGSYSFLSYTSESGSSLSESGINDYDFSNLPDPDHQTDNHAQMRLAFTPPAPTDIEITNDQSPKTNKILRDGILLIEKNGKLYNALGVEVESRK